MMDAKVFIHEQLTGNKTFPAFKSGDNITVNYKSLKVPKSVSSLSKVM